ncbi:MAG: hypothetical protein Q4F43_01440 [Eubacteriales bacterium]|nr:hypothetical protein [Eubacteriales bacterium]
MKKIFKKISFKKWIGIVAAAAVLAAAVFGFVIWQSGREAAEAIDAYNAAAQAYNEKIVPYNEAAAATAASNEELQEVLDAARAVLAEKKEAYEPKTHKTLREKIKKAEKAFVDVPVQIEPFEARKAAGGFRRADLEAQKAEAETAKQAVEEAEEKIPPVPALPDYTGLIREVQDAQKNYTDSVRKLANVTAPSDSFVTERLQEIRTVVQTGAVTADHDPNGLLGAAGGYTGCVYFLDKGVDRSLLPQDAFAEEGSAAEDEPEKEGSEPKSEEDETSDTGAASAWGEETSGQAQTAEAAAAGETAAAAGGGSSGAVSGISAEAAAEESAAAAAGTDAVKIGTDGGGAVEIYATRKEAEERAQYLAFFRGSAMDPGSCAVEGTCVIRTSRYLAEEEQEKLTKAVREALLRVEE